MDFEPLGNLTEDQKLLPRVDVKRIIYNQWNVVWAKSMRDQGIQIHECSVCHRLHKEGEQHQCFATRWTTANPNRNAPPRNVIVTQSPQGLQLRTAVIMDENKLQQEYERIKALKEGAELRKRLSAPLLPTTPDADIQMTATTTTPPAEQSSR